MTDDTHITRNCGECSRLSAAGTCLSCAEPYPSVRMKRQCIAFEPHYGADDRRTGNELWPEKTCVVEFGEGARGYLAAALVRGPVPSAEVITQAGRAGYPKRTIQRAAEQLCVVRTKAGFGAGWVWAMPKSEDA